MTKKQYPVPNMKQGDLVEIKNDQFDNSVEDGKFENLDAETENTLIQSDALLKAIKNKDVEAVKKALAGGADLRHKLTTSTIVDISDDTNKKNLNLEQPIQDIKATNQIVIFNKISALRTTSNIPGGFVEHIALNNQDSRELTIDSAKNSLKKLK